MKASKGIAYTKTIKHSGKEFRLALIKDPENDGSFGSGEYYLEGQSRWDPNDTHSYFLNGNPDMLKWKRRPGSTIHVMEQLLIDQLLVATPEYDTSAN